MKIAFAGTPEFARVALQRLHEAGHEITLVLTQPDRPAGRGMKLQASPVKQFAQQHGVPVVQPRSLRLDGKYPNDAAAAREALQGCGAEALIVAAYGLILPRWVLDLPLRGCLNIHGSLLPRWRGAAPIHRAIEAGDAATGITIMQMDEGLDTGDMLLTAADAIRPDDTTAVLHDRLAALGGALVVQALDLATQSGLRRTPQPAEGVCYAHKIDKAEAAIDWHAPAAILERRVRAFDPFPGAHFVLDGEAVKVWAAAVVPHAGGPDAPPPGTLLQASPEALVVRCGEQSLALKTLQRPGGKRQSVREFLQARALQAGQRLG